MDSVRENLYGAAFRQLHLAPARLTAEYGPAGELRAFDDERGHCEYWTYFRDELFAVNVLRMDFRQTGTMRYRHVEHLCISMYEEVRGVTQNAGAPLGPGRLAVYAGTAGGEYRARYEAGGRMRATSMAISPDYYRDYLQKRFGELDDVRAACRALDGRGDVPELAALFARVRGYRGQGAAAALFYEGAVAEAVSLALEKARRLNEEQNEYAHGLTPEDRELLDELCAYIAANLAGDLSCRALAERAYVGQTKLKRLFREALATTPAAYVTQRRMERARELLASGEPVAAAARAVGYASPGAFACAFRRAYGVAPTAARR